MNSEKQTNHELNEDDLDQVSGGENRGKRVRPDLIATCSKCGDSRQLPHGRKPTVCPNCGGNTFSFVIVENDEGYAR